jgi:predicted GNAT superfamily acetyltransferase
VSDPIAAEHADELPRDLVATALTTALLGFTAEGPIHGGEQLAWTKEIRGRRFSFRVLRSLAELTPTEELQRVVFGVSDIDFIPANAMVTAHDTGGDVLGVFDGDVLGGYSVSYGGYVERAPRVLSDFLVVREEMRSFGLGTELKNLQAGVMAERGFGEIVWTVDPLRAANARLNFEKLGAISNRYEVNRYGETFGEALYGGMPTDRLHVSWRIDSRRVRARLLGDRSPSDAESIEDLLHFDPDKPEATRALIHIPSDIDALLASDPNAAMRWRLALRDTLPVAFEAGYSIVGFVPNTIPEQSLSSLVIAKGQIDDR